MENIQNKKNNNLILLLVSLIICFLVGGLGFSLGRIYYDMEQERKDELVENKDNKNDEEVEKQEEIKDLDLTKSLNTSGLTYSNPDETASKYGLSMRVNDDKKSMILTIDWAKFGPLSGATQWANDSKDYRLIGFTKEVVSGFVGDLGQDPSGITLFFLMSDGTVEYMPMFKNLLAMNYTYEYSSDGRVIGEHFETKGGIAGVSDVFKFYSVSFSNGQTGASTVIGAKKDGSFYDLGMLVNKG